MIQAPLLRHLHTTMRLEMGKRSNTNVRAYQNDCGGRNRHRISYVPRSSNWRRAERGRVRERGHVGVAVLQLCTRVSSYCQVHNIVVIDTNDRSSYSYSTTSECSQCHLQPIRSSSKICLTVSRSSRPPPCRLARPPRRGSSRRAPRRAAPCAAALTQLFSRFCSLMWRATRRCRP